MKWFVAPETVRLDLPEGEWIEVKKELTKGERDKINAMLIKEVRQDGRMTPDFEMMSKAEVLGYLVDWSLKNGDEKIPVETDADRLSAINNMTEDGFDYLSKAVKMHVEKLEAEKPSKKAKRGETKS
jgi:hypothetical protein